MNLHFHGIWTDGVFACPLSRFVADFHPHDEVTDDDVARLVRQIRDRVLRMLAKRGKLPRDDDCAPADDPASDDPEALQALAAAAVQGRTATGHRRGQLDPRIGRGTADTPFAKGRLCCDLDGFSLHAAVRIPQGLTERLEKLCRYAARPPIVLERLSRTDDGKILYSLKKRYRDGSTHIVLEPHTLIERLCAFIPRPRKKLVNYYGAFAPAARLRDRVVPTLPDDLDDAPEQDAQRAPDDAIRRLGLAKHEPPHKPLPARIPHVPSRHNGRRKAYTWAELLRRVFRIEVLTCPHCQGPRRLLAAIFDPDAISKVLQSLGLPAEPPIIAPARPPPQARLPW